MDTKKLVKQVIDMMPSLSKEDLTSLAFYAENELIARDLNFEDTMIDPLLEDENED